MRKLERGFEPFTLVHKEKDQYCYFEPTENLDIIYVKFKGACGQVVESEQYYSIVIDSICHLYLSGYEEEE